MTKEEECFREIIIFMLLTDELIISKLSHMEYQINIKSKKLTGRGVYELIKSCLYC